jgi:hypothetical protein
MACRLPPCTAGPDDELIAVTLRGEFRPDERVDLVYLDAPGALAERQAALPLVGVNDSYTERLDIPAVVEEQLPAVVGSGDLATTCPETPDLVGRDRFPYPGRA